MNKTSLKIFFCFTFTAALISMILLCMNFLGFAALGSDTRNHYDRSPEYLLDQIRENLQTSGDSFSLSDSVQIPSDSWCILIGENGDILWSVHKPGDIPTHYSLNDVARMTKWYLNDYPVYVSTMEEGLLVLGIPKNTVGKYDLEYSMDWFDTLPLRIVVILCINLLLALLLAWIIGGILFRRLTALTNGIQSLQQEQTVVLKERGVFRELSRSINETSAAILRKNNALQEKEQARRNWIAGISHDIRTPLTLIMGNAEALEKSEGLPASLQKKSSAILLQSIRIKKLINDLNLISSLEYDMQPSQKKEVRLCPLIRRITTELLNSDLTDSYELTLDLKDEKCTARIDEPLMERALYNLLQNSITHNPKGCQITISLFSSESCANLILRDNGSGVSEEVLKKITEIPKTTHGLGLPMAYRIVTVHGGTMDVKNENGFFVQIRLPLA